MHSISISIPTEAAERLRELARRERRSPRQQAAVLVLAGLEGASAGAGIAGAPAAESTPGTATRRRDAVEEVAPAKRP